MNDFFIFYAPFIILIASIVIAFLVAPMDRAVEAQQEEKE